MEAKDGEGEVERGVRDLNNRIKMEDTDWLSKRKSLDKYVRKRNI